MEYEERKETWDRLKEEQKHTFTIAQSDKKPAHVSVSLSPVVMEILTITRGVVTRPLFYLQKERGCLTEASKPGELYEDWQKK